ncbi:MAG: hypothetical protein JWM47_978 [Acidimicrobiales bacterium]|nr:hypothetical protein [Acidimicrobiales bacterium]
MVPEPHGSGRRAAASALVERVRAWSLGHPLACVAVIAGVGALASAVYLWRARHLGQYDPDEAGYLATALRYQRSIDPAAPDDLIREIGRTANGPLVPMLSVPFLIAGPRDVRSAMLVQPVLLFATAMASAGIARRLAGPGVVILSGALVVAMPTMIMAAQSYWLGLGAACAMAVAVWALLESRRLTNRWRWAYGAATGAMLLARTMTLGYLPALALAGLLLAWGDRRRVLGWVQAMAVTAVVAAPWWYAQRGLVFDYLFGYGYGARAGQWGSGGVAERIGFRLGRFGEAAALPLPVLFLGAVAAVMVTRSLAQRHAWRPPWTGRIRDATAVAVIGAVGFAALVSTTNQGVWFETPLLVVLLPLGVAIVARSPKVLQVSLLGWLVLVAVVLPVAIRAIGVDHDDGAIDEYDVRFDRDELVEEAARQWWSVDREVTAELGQLTGRGSTGSVMITGNMYLFNSNTLELAAELDGWELRPEVPDTMSPVSDRAFALRPRSAGAPPKERFLVVVRHDLRLFTPDADWRGFARQAAASGWVVVERHELPVDGEVVIMRHPSPR